MIARVDPLIARHNFVDKYYVIPISVAVGALIHQIYIDASDGNSRLWRTIEFIRKLVQKPK